MKKQTSNKFIPVCEPSLIGNEAKYVADCLETTWISSGGKYLEQFENKFAEFCDVKYGVGVCNGTVSMHLALEALNIGPGDEVITPNFTMVATLNAVLYTGAKPVLVDADPETWCINPELIQDSVTKNTKAIMPVHIYGHPCDMNPINKIAHEQGLKVVEDAAEAHGALYKNKKAGSLGDAASFSFYGNKILTTGEGGMVVTNDKKLAERMQLLKNHAFTKNRFTHDEVGFNYRMTNIQAALGLAQLENADKLVQMRIDNAAQYTKLLSSVAGIVTPPKKEWAKNVYWMYGILLDDFGMSRDELREKLREKGVDTRAFFVPLHEQPLVQQKGKYAMPDASGNFAVSENLGANGLYLPSTSTLPKEDLVYVVDAIKEIKESV